MKSVFDINPSIWFAGNSTNIPLLSTSASTLQKTPFQFEVWEKVVESFTQEMLIPHSKWLGRVWEYNTNGWAHQGSHHKWETSPFHIITLITDHVSHCDLFSLQEKSDFNLEKLLVFLNRDMRSFQLRRRSTSDYWEPDWLHSRAERLFSLDFLFVFSSKREAETRLINVFTLK